jgi:hypothetical protein
MNAYRGAPMTLGNAAAAKVPLIVWCPEPRGKHPGPGARRTPPQWRIFVNISPTRLFPLCMRPRARALIFPDGQIPSGNDPDGICYPRGR